MMLEAVPPGLFVDIGANIGACSMHVLLSTASKQPLLAFEPGAANFAYFSNSLNRLAADGVLPDAPQRLRLLRWGMGAQDSSEQLYQAVGNAGHAVLGQKPTKYAPKGHEVPQTVDVHRLDDVLWPDARDAQLSSPARELPAPPPAIALVKLDVEGWECEALKGMSALLHAGAIAAMKVEVFDALLQLQGCSAVQLQTLVANAGFDMYLIANEAHTGVVSTSALPSTPPIAPHLRATTTEQYNLWCVRRRGRQWRQYLNARAAERV